MSSCQTVVLVCHPASSPSAVSALQVRVSPAEEGGLSLAYRLEGRPEGLCIPSPGRSGPADGLWEHTCFEAFVAADDGPAYREFNFSPSGQWAVYAFSDYRQRDHAFQPAAVPEIVLHPAAGGLELDVVLPPSLLPPAPPGSVLRLGLTAVVEAADGGKTYWALAHPGPRPDFHLRAAFLLPVAVPPPSP